MKQTTSLTQFAKFSAVGLALGAILVSANPGWADESQVYDFSGFTKIEISESIDGFVTQDDRYP
ncbi:hypothetical protein [Maritalea mediterranea]|uniref:Uncharacterized protein n=1 Tax=Maritalea mediterranea TaxID=2909667 RepID=A0ABS9E7H3_9HYPH|nr:hypothetical protein [Maritalea mediterranea]MCF4098792.1 hypothetical protein [Maritalea mediterranea]